jgi:alpha-D-ribose 1-methylphosphonate 5-triphosphate synthase subunit PhnL
VTFWISDWLRAFAVTLLVEIPVATPLLAGVERKIARRIAIVVVANLATHPLVWFLFPGLAFGRGTRLALSEAWAFAAELAIYMIVWPSLRLRRAALVSLLANGASVAAGVALARLVAGR